MKKFFKQLFCFHDYYVECYHEITWIGIIFTCKKCNHKYRTILFKKKCGDK